MTLSSWTSTVNVTSDALFRTEMQAIHDAIVAVGLVQTSDTGQVTISSMTRPATNIAAGYEIFKFNDSLQTNGAPVFIKIEYGTGNNTSTCSVWFTVGTSTDGAGTITGNQTSRYQLQNSAATAGTFTSGMSGSSSRLTFVWCNNGGNTISHWATIERLLDSSGANTSTGFVFMYASRTLGNTGNACQVVYYSGNQPPVSTCIPTLMANVPVATTWVVGTDTGTGPILPVGWGVHPAIHGGLTYFNADLTVANQFTISIYGNNHTFLSLGSNSVGSLYNLHTSASILARWD